MEGGQALRLIAVGDTKMGAASCHAILGFVNVNTTAASAVVTIYDGQSTTGTKVAAIDASGSTGKPFEYMIRCENGVYAVMTGGNADVTVTVF